MSPIRTLVTYEKNRRLVEWPGGKLNVAENRKKIRQINESRISEFVDWLDRLTGARRKLGGQPGGYSSLLYEIVIYDSVGNTQLECEMRSDWVVVIERFRHG